MSSSFDLSRYEIRGPRILRNPSPGELYDEAILLEDAVITSSGALTANSGAKTGRSPKDKRIVDHPDSSHDIWWGDVNIRFEERSLLINRQRAIDYLNICDELYVIDGFAGWDPKYRLKVRVICARAYHALFMHNMLIRPTDEELATFGEPDYVIYNAGRFPANRYSPQMTSTTSVAISFERREIVILGTQYAGEMKKGIFTVMNYLMPKRGVLSMHCSANEGPQGDVSLFFGLSGTGKTTLSADPARRLIGDDEHCWTDEGIFNIEGGCYAKCIDLSPAGEPQIFQAIKFGAILENVAFDPRTRVVDYTDASLTENTRAAYPIEFIPNAKIPCIGHQPQNIILLTCDAFGVLPPVSRLSRAQLMYHFLSGYTAKIAGTEQGVTEPQATFSACFGAAFLVWHPMKYAHLLADRMQRHGAQAWLVNTGWTGGAAGTGKRIKLAYTRAIIDAIHAGALADVVTVTDPVFGLAVPRHVPGVPSEVLAPRNTWPDPAAYDATAEKLAGLFQENFARYDDHATKEVRAAGPNAAAAFAANSRGAGAEAGWTATPDPGSCARSRSPSFAARSGRSGPEGGSSGRG